MRIVAGRHKGRRIAGPEDSATTRPITDRVKTALFDRLTAAGRVDGAVVLELFSGTGSIGLEALSRGAAHVVFVERDRSALRRLRENLNLLGEADRSHVLKVDALSAGLIAAVGGRRFDLIFLDPPYRLLREPRGRDRLWAQVGRLHALAAPEAELILRAEKHEQVAAVAPWAGPDAYTYGSMTLHHYHAAGVDADPDTEAGTASGATDQ